MITAAFNNCLVQLLNTYSLVMVGSRATVMCVLSVENSLTPVQSCSSLHLILVKRPRSDGSCSALTFCLVNSSSHRTVGKVLDKGLLVPHTSSKSLASFAVRGLSLHKHVRANRRRTFLHPVI